MAAGEQSVLEEGKKTGPYEHCIGIALFNMGKVPLYPLINYTILMPWWFHLKAPGKAASPL